jgi:hypothetical protein
MFFKTEFFMKNLLAWMSMKILSTQAFSSDGRKS